MVSHPENGSDSPIGSDRDWGRDTLRGKLIHGMMYMGNVIAWLLRGKIICMAECI